MSLPLSLLLAHFVGDFLFQTDWMALNKSKSWLALCVHVACYTTCFAPFGIGFGFLTTVFLSHFLTDAVTSRVTNRLWFMTPIRGGGFRLKHPNTRHWFFVAIGLDQLIHYITLAYIWAYFNGS